MVLMIDNFDSFTWNVVRYFEELGAQVQVYRNNAITLEQIEAVAPSHLVISPGPCTPAKAGISVAAIRHFAGRLPILGVCLGHQCIGQAFGAEVVRARQVMHGKTSMIEHLGDGVFKGLKRPLEVTRYHSLVVRRDSLPDCLEMVAWTRSEKGAADEIMALRHRELALFGVQSATDSPRAIDSLAVMYLRNNEYEKANTLLQEQGERLSHSSLLTARLLLQKVYTGVATEKDFIEAAERLQYQPFDAQTVKGVRAIVERVIGGNNTDYAVYTLKLLDTMNQSAIYNQYPLFVRLQYYLRGQLYRYLEKPRQMLENYSEAIQHYNETDSALAIVVEVASAGYYMEAMQLLDQSEQVLARQPDRSLKRSRESYELDIANLRQQFNNALEQEASVHED